MIRGGRAPDLAEIKDWIGFASNTAHLWRAVSLRIAGLPVAGLPRIQDLAAVLHCRGGIVHR